MTINEIYGAGSALALVVALQPMDPYTVDTVQADIPNGARVYVKWFDGATQFGAMKVDFFSTVAHFQSFNLDPPYRALGIYSRLLNRLCNFLEDRGVTYITAAPRNRYSSWVLQLGGFVPNPDWRTIRCDIGPGSRRKSYVAWKLSLAAEPAWHVTLKAQAPPVEDAGGLPVVDD